ncbi:MAG: HEPN domain-containing protein [Nanoarchaeota archaeon]|nr:HEPN domain-containing protein [Nanoarchaeota archaeon]
MDSKAKLYMQRAENEIILAKTNFDISMDNKLKEVLKLKIENTFFNDVISQCYYSIFYAAKAYLISRNMGTEAPEEHRKTYEAFEKIVDSGKVNRELLEIYESEAEKAEVLLKIFHLEKKKRGRFTYDVNANANIPYAKESLENARKFVSIIKNLIEKEE